MPEQKVKTHGMLVGGFSPYTKAHHENVKQMQGSSHASVNVFATQSSRRPISAEKKVDYIKTAAGEGVNVNTTLTPFHAAAHLHAAGKRGKLVLYGGSDRAPIADRLREYNGKEGKHGYYNFEGGIEFRQVGGERKEGAKGLAGISGTAARKAKNPQELKKFIPKELHPRAEEIFNDMNESINPIGIFLLGGPGSGKDYVLKNIFSRFDLTEVQADHVLNGTAGELITEGKNIVINGALDEEKIQIISSILENYNLDTVYVSVTNKVSRLRNSLRENPLSENKRIEKWYRSEKMIESLEDTFVFNNSINLNESSEMERVFFANQIEKLLERLNEHGLIMKEEPSPQNITLIREKKFPAVRKKYGMPAKYSSGLSKSTALARKRHWAKANKLSDSDPEAYKPAPGDATAKTKPSKHTLAVRKMMGEEIVTEGKADKSIAAKAAKSGISLRTLKAVYRRGVAAWNSGHRPGTTPSQWGHARVNSYINKGKTYHTADKDLREDSDIDELFEMQLVGTDEYRRHAISMTPGQNQEIEDVTKTMGLDSAEGDCDCVYESDCECDDEMSAGNRKSFREFRAEAKETQVELLPTADVTPTLSKSKPDNSKKTPAKPLRAAVDGMAITSRLTGEEVEQVDEGIVQGVTQGFKKLRTAFRDATSPVKGVPSPENITKTRPVRPELKNVNAPTTQSNIDPRIARRRSEVQAANQVAADRLNARSLEQIVKDQQNVGQRVAAVIPNSVKRVGKAAAAVIPEPVKQVGRATAAAGKAVVDTAAAAKKAVVDAAKTPLGRAAIRYSNVASTYNLAKNLAALDTPETAAERQKQLGALARSGAPPNIAAAAAAAAVTDRIVTRALDTELGKKWKASRDVPDPWSVALGAVVPGFSAKDEWEKLKGDTAYWSKKLTGQKTNEEVELIKEAVEYHLSEGISFTENAFRPGSEMFFEMVNIAKNLYKEGAYKPADEWEKDMLNSHIGERAIFEGREVILDYPFEEELNEEDKTEGKGIGKPWREGGGGAVYVRSGDSVKKIRFSQSGMKKKFMDPAATRSFVARHHCLTNKDKTSASYWACRYPRFFSNSGKVWW
jgi:hypothetical protein